MELINESLILSTENITFKISEFKFEKKIFVNNNLNYGSLVKHNNLNYIYYRDDVISNKNKPEHEIIKRFIIKDVFDIVDDETFSLSLGIASHNFRLFNINNNIYGIGGQSLGSKNHNEFINTTNEKYDEYNRSDVFIVSSPYNINHLIGKYLFDPNIPCPYYANGLYLFEFNNDNITELNNKLPIISGVKNGRHDGHYGHSNNKNDGISVFDSTTNILYNEKEKKYFLYQRSNFGTGIRHIQYCTSYDLLEWSDFNLVEYTPTINLFQHNIYYGNFFKLDGVNNYIAIIPFNKKVNGDYHGLDPHEYFELRYSKDCITWDYIGLLSRHLYYTLWMIIGEPILLNNNYYFYFYNSDDKSIIINSFEKNRFSYFKSIENQLAKISFKPTLIKNNKIIINFKTYENGFLRIQLLDSDKKIIEGYSLDDFDIIQECINDTDFYVSWNKETNINIENEVYIQLEGVNFELFSINI